MVASAKTAELKVADDVAVAELDGSRVFIRRVAGAWQIDQENPDSPEDGRLMNAAMDKLVKDTDEVVASIKRGAYADARSAFDDWGKRMTAAADQYAQQRSSKR